MATIDGRATLSANITIALSESEAAALDALAAYGTDAFLKAFYKELGESALKRHEAGLRSLFASLRDGNCGLKAVLQRANDARQVFNGDKIAVGKRV